MQARSLRTFSPHSQTQRYAAGIGFVALIHAVLIYALWQIGVVNAIFSVPKPIIVVDVPLVPPTNVVKPPPLPGRPGARIETPIEPEIIYEATDQPPNNGITQSPADAGSSGPASIAYTHTIPPYPPVDIRLGNQGTVSLRVIIDANGFVSDAMVVRSSGFPRLDEAAAVVGQGALAVSPGLEERPGGGVGDQCAGKIRDSLVPSRGTAPGAAGWGLPCPGGPHPL